jgi:hypothetical protein
MDGKLKAQGHVINGDNIEAETWARSESAGLSFGGRSAITSRPIFTSTGTIDVSAHGMLTVGVPSNRGRRLDA